MTKTRCSDCRDGDHRWCGPEDCACECWAYLRPMDPPECDSRDCQFVHAHSTQPTEEETTNG